MYYVYLYRNWLSMDSLGRQMPVISTGNPHYPNNPNNPIYRCLNRYSTDDEFLEASQT